MDSGLSRFIFRSTISSVSLFRRTDDMVQAIRARLLRDYGSMGPHIYGMHNQQVRDMVPKGQLLEYNVKEGWEPLCAFLEIDVPDRPFPHLNEGGSIKAVMRGQQILGATTWVIYLTGLVGLVYLAAKPELARSIFSFLRTGWR